jgi:hypothetical protein
MSLLPHFAPCMPPINFNSGVSINLAGTPTRLLRQGEEGERSSLIEGSRCPMLGEAPARSGSIGVETLIYLMASSYQRPKLALLEHESRTIPPAVRGRSDWTVKGEAK